MSTEPAGPFERIKALVIARTLHHYYADKDALLRERVVRRMAAVGCDAAFYLQLLQGGAGSEAEWELLEAEITIGETFFFRYAEQFAALHDTILPALIQARAGTRRLRIWSAGCASGAEPYSVAILLHRLLGPALPHWSVSILGTDISGAALETARTAEYGDWALRSLSETERRRDFIEVPSASGIGASRWRLRPSYCSMVQFERRNLLQMIDAEDQRSADAELAPVGGYDLVLCRNVLIYFHPDRVQALVTQLGRSLSPDGWLLLGHAEAAAGGLVGLRQVQLGAALAWQPAAAAGEPAQAGSWATAASVVARVPDTAQDARRLRTLRPQVAAAAPAADRKPVPDQVRALADAGRHDEALQRCRAALSLQPASPSLLFYAALLARALGREDEAEADLRRAISLGQDFAMAHYHLGLLLADAGRLDPGRRAIAEAGRIAASLRDDAVLEGGDGMTAAQLRALTRLDWLAGSPATP